MYKDKYSAESALDKPYPRGDEVTTLRDAGYVAVPYSELEFRINNGLSEQQAFKEQRLADKKESRNRQASARKLEQEKRQKLLENSPMSKYRVEFQTTAGQIISRTVDARDNLEAKQKATKLVKQKRDNTFYVPGDDEYIHFSSPRIFKLS